MNNLKPEITNKQAEREWLFIVQKVGSEKALAAIGQLAGQRRPFPTNIAKVLNIKFPPLHLLPEIPEDRERNLTVAEEALTVMRKGL